MNRQSYDTDTEKGKKQFFEQLNVLINYNTDPDNKYYHDIHIYQEESLIILEWDTVPYSQEWGGKFQYIDYDDVVMKEVHFPDNHYEYVFPEEVDETVKQWHEDHPEWVQTSYGTWTNMEENRINNIDWNIDKWIEKEVSEDDSTFTESIFEFDPVMGKTPLDLIVGMADSQVLQRTEMVIVSKSDLREFLALDVELDDYKIQKIGTSAFSIQPLYFKEPYVKEIFVYAVEKDLHHKILFVTDNYYLIHKIECKEKE